MATIVKLGELVTLADSNELEIEFDPSQVPTHDERVACIEVVNGPVRIASGEAVDDAKHYAWPTGKAAPYPFQNTFRNLRFKGAAGVSFAITAIQ